MEFSELKGKTLSKVEAEEGSERIVFQEKFGEAFASEHMQDCCESVNVNKIEGDINNLIDSPILEAIEETFPQGEPDPATSNSWTWTRQTLRTEKGIVIFTWLGESNGYYGEIPYFGYTQSIEL